MNETPDTLAIGVGMLTVEQAASQLPFDAPVNAVLLTKRLVARRSLASVELGNAVRIPMDKLTAFMADNGQNSAVRQALGLPLETFTPLFPILENQRNWFGPGPIDTLWWGRSLVAEMQKLLPAQLKKAEPGMISTSADILLVDAGVPIVNIDLAKTPDPARLAGLKTILNAPTPVASPFKNMGEVFLAQRLQEVAWMHTMRLHSQPGVIKELGVEYFYKSPAAYGAVVAVAGDDMQKTAALTAEKFYSEVNARVLLMLSGAALMNMCGSNPGRLACLAF